MLLSHLQFTLPTPPKLPSPPKPLSPVLVWHGLGDSFDSDSMERVVDALKSADQSLYVYVVRLADSGDEDQKKSFMANMTQELAQVCDDILSDKVIELAVRTRLGVNMVGLLQGGLFLRMLIQTCPKLGKVNTLVTFGSPLNGILDLPRCSPNDFICKSRNSVFRKHVWDDSLQDKVVFAQYFRDTVNWDTYLQHSKLLAPLNNEGKFEPSLQDYGRRVDRMVMYRFTEDTVVVPRDSAWFSDWDKDGNLIPLKKSRQWTENLLGLREVDLLFREVEAEHMRDLDGALEDVSAEFFV